MWMSVIQMSATEQDAVIQNEEIAWYKAGSIAKSKEGNAG
jgi:hypothetical protein